jgi:hypothetical protein
MEKQDNKQISLLIRNKILYAEIKAMQQEYVRMQKQINEIIIAQKDCVFSIQKRYDEAQKNAEKLEEIEVEMLIKYEK